jgi:hypothetical protein
MHGRANQLGAGHTLSGSHRVEVSALLTIQSNRHASVE